MRVDQSDLKGGRKLRPDPRMRTRQQERPEYHM